MAISLSCVGTNPGLQVQGLLAPTDLAMCSFSAGAGSARILSPTLDVFRRTAQEKADGLPISVPIQYQGVFQIVSFLIARGSRQFPLQVDPNTLNLTAAEVTLRNSTTGALISFRGLPNPFSIAIAQVIRSSTGTDGSFGIAAVPVLPPQYGEQLEALPAAVDANMVALPARSQPRANPRTILASVKVSGMTVGGVGVESSTYTFPLTLCDRCLISCDRLPSPSTDFSPVVSCAPGQDTEFGYRQAELCP